MAALTSEVPVLQVGEYAAQIQIGVDGAAAKIYESAMVCALTATGYAVKAGVANTGPVLGVAQGNVDNSGGSDGDLSVDLLQGLFWRPNAGTVTQAHYGEVIYAGNDQDVTATKSTNPIAGICLGVDSSQGVLVLINAGLNHALQSIDELYVDATSAQGEIEIPIGNIADADGDFTKFVNGGADGLTLADSKAFCYRINNAGPPPQSLCSFAIPADADITADMTLNFLCSKNGATLGDATTITVAAYAQADAALHDADADFGGATSALVGDAAAKTLDVISLTLALADLPAVGSNVTLSFAPTNGTLGTDDLMIHRVWVNYTRKLRTS